MTNITLDNNCLIDLEEQQGAFTDLVKLVNLWRQQKIQLCVTAITAAELTKDGQMAQRLDDFHVRISKAGLDGIRILTNIFYWGIGYFDGTSIYGTPEMYVLERKIHEILFSGIEYSYQDYCDSQGVAHIRGQFEQKWRNAKIDVLCMWSHIHNRCDIFITRDKNFHKLTKKEPLISLGANNIMYPTDALLWIQKNLDKA